MAFDPITAAFGIGEKLIERLWPNPKDREEAMLKLEQLRQQGDLAQIAVNLAEAKSESLFVAGWRPFVGWVCASALAYTYVAQPFMIFVSVSYGRDLTGLPELDLTTMLPVLLGMLGLGGLRTYEKRTGTNMNR